MGKIMSYPQMLDVQNSYQHVFLKHDPALWVNIPAPWNIWWSIWVLHPSLPKKKPW